MLDRIFSLLRVNRKLILGKNATMVVTSTAGVETSLDMAELAALNGISATELGFIDGVTAGTGLASKALVLNSSGQVTMPDGGYFDFSNAALAAAGTGQSTYAVIADQINGITGADGTKGVALPAASAGRAIFIVNTDQSNTLAVAPVNAGNDQINSLTAGTGVFTMGPARGAWFIPTSATQWYVTGDAAITSTPTEITYTDVTTTGTAQASKALVVDANKDIISLRNVSGVNFDAGASGTAGTVDVFPTTAAKGKLAVTCTDQTGDTTVSLVAGAMAAARTITIPDPGAAASVLMTTGSATATTATTTELNVVAGVTAGTATASKALVLGASKEIATITSATITTLTSDALRAGANGQFLETQVAATAKTTSTTLTAAELLTGIITVNQGGGAVSTLTLPLATGMDTALAASAANDAFDFSLINISTVAAEDAVIATNTGWTIVGNLDVASNAAATDKSAGRFRARKTATGAWTLYRLS